MVNITRSCAMRWPLSLLGRLIADTPGSGKTTHDLFPDKTTMARAQLFTGLAHDHSTRDHLVSAIRDLKREGKLTQVAALKNYAGQGRAKDPTLLRDLNQPQIFARRFRQLQPWIRFPAFARRDGSILLFRRPAYHSKSLSLPGISLPGVQCPGRPPQASGQFWSRVQNGRPSLFLPPWPPSALQPVNI
jgi:hypothetical protein